MMSIAESVERDFFSASVSLAVNVFMKVILSRIFDMQNIFLISKSGMSVNEKICLPFHLYSKPVICIFAEASWAVMNALPHISACFWIPLKHRTVHLSF